MGRRDDRLLDAIDELDRVRYDGPMWRAAQTGRSPLDGSKGSGRWNPASLSVLYGCTVGDGAVAEIHYHLNRGQPVFPSKSRWNLHELTIVSDKTLEFLDMAALKELGVDAARYSEMLYDRTQEIADAAAFLGYDGILAPSARWQAQNIILFLDNFDHDNFEIVTHAPINWREWRKLHGA